MGIHRIELQGQLIRTQDYQAVKHQEDSRSAVEQNALQAQLQKQGNVKLTRVQDGEKATSQHMSHHDASEQGKNEYAGDGGKKRRQSQEKDGKVLLKGIQKREVVVEDGIN